MRPGVLTFYRIMAYVTAVLLLGLCVAVILKYGYWVGLWPEGSPTQQLGTDWSFGIGVVHGWLYMLYLLVAVILTSQLRIPKGRMLLVLLAGTIPFGAFFAERKVVHWYRLRAAGEPIVPSNDRVETRAS